MKIEFKFWRYFLNSANACFTIGLLVWMLFSLAMLLIFTIFAPILMWVPIKESRIRPLHEYISAAVEMWCKEVEKVRQSPPVGVEENE